MFRKISLRLSSFKFGVVFTKKRLLLFLVIFGVPVLVLVTYVFYFWNKIQPGIRIVTHNVGGLNQDEATYFVSTNTTAPENITLVYGEEVFVIPAKDIELKYNFQETVRKAYYLYRTGNIFYDLRGIFSSYFDAPIVEYQFNINEVSLEEYLSVISGQISVEPIYPFVEEVEGEIIVFNGSAGLEIEKDKLKQKIDRNISFAINESVEIPVKHVDPTIDALTADTLKKRAEKLINKNIIIVFKDNIYEYSGNDILKLLGANNLYSQLEIDNFVERIAKLVEREPQNSVFVFEDGKVKEFKPSLDGIKIKKQDFSSLLINHLDLLESNNEDSVTIDVPFESTDPSVNTEDVNDLGIKELLGRGSSNFAGSISSRIHNIGVAASKFNGVLIEPGKTFSFNNIIGDVSSYTGYKQAYIIKDGNTILGDGGGVCQVSTTLFRAALKAGLPVAERRAHSYRVAYYEQGYPPGLDATVYAPTTDLKLVNNTPGHILIQTFYDPKNATLDFDIYGTNDGRVATTTKPVVTDVTPPPEDLYIDDPTKPIGYLEQIDWKAWGAKVNFDYIVERDGEIIFEKTFYSNFHPWQSKFIRGTASSN